MDDRAFLDMYVFAGLHDLNDGFDTPSISYFSREDFETVLERVARLGLGVYGIEPWPNGEYACCLTFEEYGDDPCDPAWYRRAFQDLLDHGVESHFAASYCVPNTTELSAMQP